VLRASTFVASAYIAVPIVHLISSEIVNLIDSI